MQQNHKKKTQEIHFEVRSPLITNGVQVNEGYKVLKIQGLSQHQIKATDTANC